jgi:hypothetical protein
MDRLEAPQPTAKIRANTFGQLIDLHVQDMKGVGRAPRRSKDATLQALNAQLGGLRLDELTRERFIQFGRDRARRGAGPVTVNIDFSYIRLVISHAAAVHGVAVSPEPVELARIALKRLGIIGKSRARERRPTANELERLIGYLDANPRQLIPMGRIVRFAVAKGGAPRRHDLRNWVANMENIWTMHLERRFTYSDKDGGSQAFLFCREAMAPLDSKVTDKALATAMRSAIKLTREVERDRAGKSARKNPAS